MAGDWIKMRGALLDHPKVIAIGRALHRNKEFREWLTPGGAGPSNGQIISDAALRCVTTALLMRVWSVSREHGHFVNDDLVLEHSEIGDLDQMSGAPGVGVAMLSVRWALEENGVTLPNFKEFNVPMSAADKQREYRNRNKEGNAVVTEALPSVGNENGENVTSRVEKRREDINTPRAKKKAKKLLPEGWAPSESTLNRLSGEFRFTNGDGERYVAFFTDYCKSAGKEYANFDSAFSNCVRSDWPKFRNGAATMPKHVDPQRPSW